ncbi:uncharacterized protein LOC134267181 isoform X2 [Saccostrea cucullata]|uniref:uncharacterized protein LOC134267181 isoform X2 n=1 Tax=Saccostrea cuccullata TaxID=36930 RepID=UPI002ED25723
MAGKGSRTKKAMDQEEEIFTISLLDTTDQLEYECDVTKEVFLLLQTDAQAREEFLQSMKADGLKPVDKSKQALDEKHAEENEQLPKTWARKETDMLVALRMEKDEEFRKSKVHQRIWNNIAAEMTQKGYKVNGQKAANKWKSLKRSYMEVIDHNSKSGNDAKTVPYMTDFNMLYGNKPSTKPAYTLHSSGSGSATSSSETKLKKRAISPSGSSSESDTPVKMVKKIPGRQIKKKNTVLDFLQNYAEKQSEQMKQFTGFSQRATSCEAVTFGQIVRHP